MLGEPELERMLHVPEREFGYWSIIRAPLAAPGFDKRRSSVPLQAEMLSEIDLSHAVIINDFIRFSVGEDAAIVNDVRTITNA